MADRMEVDMIVKAIAQGFDKVEKEIKGVGTTSEATGKQTERASKGMGMMAGVMKTAVLGGAALAGAALLKFGRDSIAAASFVEESSSKFAIVFGDMADSVTARLNEFATASGQSRYQLAAFAATMGDTLKPMGFTLEAAGDLSVSIVKLATDLASFNNMPVDEALRRLQSTLIGNHENALAFGVIINENVLKQELAAMGADNLTGAMLEQAKAQARYNLLLRGTTDAQGDAIRTADSYANQQKALASAVEELSVSFGQLLLPAATKTVSALRDLAQALQVVFDVSAQGGDIIEGIVDEQIEQADSVDDLVAAYNRAKKQLEMWGGAAALVTGTTDDLLQAQIRLSSAVLDTAGSADEYIKAMKAMGLVGNNVGQMTEEQARAFYANEKAARAAAAAKRELRDADRELELQIERAYTPTALLTEATEEATWSTYDWSSAVGMQIAQAKLGAQAMENKAIAMDKDAEATALAAEANAAYAEALLNWYTTAVNSADAAFVVSDKTGEMTSSLENANAQLYQMAQDAKMPPQELAILGVALGVITEDAANAALKSMLFTAGLKEIVEQAMETGPITAEMILKIKDEAAELLGVIEATPDVIDIEYITNTEQARRDAEEVRDAALAAQGIYKIHFDISASGMPAWALPPGATPPTPGSTPGEGGGQPAPTPMAMGTGGEFVMVPPGFPNDSYMVAMTSGEHFAVTRPGESVPGGYGGDNITFNITSNDPQRVADEVGIILARRARLNQAARV